MNGASDFSLDNRLALCADFVRDGAKVADIGTDHAYLPVWLCRIGRCDTAIAADINPLPLERGIETINNAGFHLNTSGKYSVSYGPAMRILIDFNDINNLKNACIDYDKIHLKLEIDYKLSNGEKYGNNMNKINEFMFYDDNKLVGYAGICDFGGDEIEVNGMVHPDCRRRRIF